MCKFVCMCECVYVCVCVLCLSKRAMTDAAKWSLMGHTTNIHSHD